LKETRRREEGKKEGETEDRDWHMERRRGGMAFIMS
jgi:hypothetical protein